MTAFATELVGYIGGFVAAVALIPQVVHTYKTQSSGDLSYVWQATYLTGLAFDLCYMLMLQATAGWVTLTIEIFFSLVLLAMKLRMDGYCCCANSDDAAFSKENIINEEYDEETANSSSVHSLEQVEQELPPLTLASCQHREALELQSPMDDQKRGRSHLTALVSCLTVDANCRGFHIVMIESDAGFTSELPLIGFGQTLMDELQRLATLHQTRIVHPNIETFNGSEETTPRGFSLAALIGESCCRISVYCNFNQGTLAWIFSIHQQFALQHKMLTAQLLKRWLEMSLFF